MPLDDATALPTLFDNGEFHLDIGPNADAFRVLAPGLARALGYREARDVLRGIPDDEKGSELVRTPGGDQLVGYVTEAGFYRALGQRQTSRIADQDTRAAVQRFQSWVYREVLPAIRKTGSYSAQPATTLRRPADPTRAELARMVLTVEQEREALAGALESAAPAIDYYRRYVTSDDVVQVAVWGAQFGLTRPQAHALLVDRGLIYRTRIGEQRGDSEQRDCAEREYRAYAKCLHWFALRPQHTVPRHHNGQVRQTLYVRQQYALNIAVRCGLSAPDSHQEIPA